MQLGYEPCPPKPGKSFFGKPILVLPGILGYSSHIYNSLIYESLVLVATNAMVYAFNSLYTEKQGDELANWPPYIFNMAATSMFYPLVVVSNCMAVTGSGLAAGQPDNMPRFQ